MTPPKLYSLEEAHLDTDFRPMGPESSSLSPSQLYSGCSSPEIPAHAIQEASVHRFGDQL